MSDYDWDEVTRVMQAHVDSASGKMPDVDKSVVDKNCLSYWFPKLQTASIPVPKTEILEMPEACRAEVWACFDGKPPGRAVEEFRHAIEAAGSRLGFPCFLRTGQTSNKHNWERTCRLARDSDIASHIYRLAEFSECADFMGLPWHIWAVREMLPTKPLAVLPRYGNFPLVPEVRCFVSKGAIQCCHPYWPEDSIREGGCESKAVIECAQSWLATNYAWIPIAQKVAELFSDDEAFSVDLLPTDRGIFVTDMALADRSFHWPDCPNNPDKE